MFVSMTIASVMSLVMVCLIYICLKVCLQWMGTIVTEQLLSQSSADQPYTYVEMDGRDAAHAPETLFDDEDKQDPF